VDGAQAPRRVPSAFKPGARGVASGAPATFGGPGFNAPATQPPQRSVAVGDAEFGGPGFARPATRDLPPDPVRAPEQQVPATGTPERPRVPGASDVRPPARPASLLAAPDHRPPASVPAAPVVEALGRRPLPADLSPAERLDLTGPVRPVDVPVRDPTDATADGDTVLWSATMPPLVDGEMTTATPAVPADLPIPRAADPASTRVKIVFSERRGGAHPVRTVVDIQEGGAVGELLRSDLIGSQLRVALRFALLAGLTLGLLPLAFALFPAIGRAEVLGLRLPWLLLGFVVYPLLWGLGWWHTRMAERVEQNFADHVQE
jgi:hypothetical protein